jgi:hypothetical protein
VRKDWRSPISRRSGAAAVGLAPDWNPVPSGGARKEQAMYIGIGTIVIIVIIVLVVLMLRRLCPGRLAAWGGGLTEGRAHGGHDLSRLVQQGPEGFADGIADQFGEAVGPYRVLTGEPAVE